ncbi:TetR/AcrR family transcriptional regulator [Amycolatopsis sp. CA-230715]|uniref:TetR/AcrR family transcriptional regulator n=1 Tax=Amycolatopsis sp. CA-230715 TaxID=2745196 RepID=UPI001C01232A|nr:TetR/AcrR family transcriptional regulator [Amycolatopsis sp. CA-230715]QWF76914.1 Tetracycline repressor protein class A from transposon 1721 [Amycolatopsis sp. CA-230715]
MRGELTRDGIVRAALRLVTEEGLAKLTMRRLGTELGVEGMALYHHFRNKDELLQALAESVFEDPPPPTGDWRADFRALSHAGRAALNRYPEVFPLLVSRPLTGKPALRHREAQYAVLHAMGLRDERLLDASRTWGSFLLGYAVVEHEARTGTRSGLDWSPPPAAEFPLISALDRFQGARTFDEQFEIGLDHVLAAIENLAGA